MKKFFLVTMVLLICILNCFQYVFADVSYTAEHEKNKKRQRYICDSTFVAGFTTQISDYVEEINRKQAQEKRRKEKIEAEKKAAEKRLYEYNLYLLSHVIHGEAGNSTYNDKLYVGSVVLNRVNHKLFNNTIESVIFQKGQYACTWDGNFYTTPDEESINIAKYLLAHGSALPGNVVFQAGFVQGNGIYLKENTHYYCVY